MQEKFKSDGLKLRKSQGVFIKMYEIDQDKIREGLHEEMKGTLNMLEIRLNSPHQKMEFVGALSNYYIKRQEATRYLKEDEIKKYDDNMKELFDKFAIKTIERKNETKI